MTNEKGEKGERRKSTSFICENEGGRERYSGCNAVSNLLVMEKEKTICES